MLLPNLLSYRLAKRQGTDEKRKNESATKYILVTSRVKTKTEISSVSSAHHQLQTHVRT